MNKETEKKDSPEIESKKWKILMVSRIIGFLIACYAVFVFFSAANGEQPSYINRFIVAPGYCGAFVGLFALYLVKFIGVMALIAFQGLTILLTAFIAWSAFFHMILVFIFQKYYERETFYKSFFIFIILWVLGAILSIPPSESWAD